MYATLTVLKSWLGGNYGVYFFFAAVSAAGAVFAAFLLPETKGKTAHDIRFDMIQNYSKKNFDSKF